VLARMDSNRVHEDFYRAHPDWFARDANGEPYRNTRPLRDVRQQPLLRRIYSVRAPRNHRTFRTRKGSRTTTGPA